MHKNWILKISSETYSKTSLHFITILYSTGDTKNWFGQENDGVLCTKYERVLRKMREYIIISSCFGLARTLLMCIAIHHVLEPEKTVIY